MRPAGSEGKQSGSLPVQAALPTSCGGTVGGGALTTQGAGENKAAGARARPLSFACAELRPASVPCVALLGTCTALCFANSATPLSVLRSPCFRKAGNRGAQSLCFVGLQVRICWREEFGDSRTPEQTRVSLGAPQAPVNSPLHCPWLWRAGGNPRESCLPRRLPNAKSKDMPQRKKSNHMYQSTYMQPVKKRDSRLLPALGSDARGSFPDFMEISRS